MKKELHFKNFLKTFMVIAIFGIGQLGYGQNTYNLITSTTDLVAGSKYIIASSQNNGSAVALGYQNTNNRPQASITISSGAIVTTPATLNTETTKVFEITLGGTSGAWTLFDPVNSGFLKATSSTNNNLVSTAPSANWTISFSTNAAVMTCTTGGFTRNILRHNTSSSLFSCYATGQNAVYLYKLATPTLLTWTGTTNNLWSVASNWSPAIVPDGSIDVLINTGSPVLDVDFTVASGKTLTVSGSGSLTVNPTRTLTVAGSAAFNNNPIIFKSNNTGTGTFGSVAIPTNVTGVNNITVERFIEQGRRAVRFLTPSVTTLGTIFQYWQNSGNNITTNIGTHITGSSTGGNGFDATITGNPSLFTYNAQVTSGTGFTAIPNTNATTLTAGVGYRLLVRGDRTVDLNLSSQENMNGSTTLRSTGTLLTGPISYTASAGPVLINNQSGNTQTNGYTLIGNPYISAVDWHLVTKNNVDANAYYTWNPALGTAAQRGRYVVYTQTGAETGSSSILEPTEGIDAVANRRFLQTGQAFFIKNASGQIADLTFNEFNKVINNQNVFRIDESALTTNNSSLYLSVYEPNELAIGGTAIDGAAALFGTDYASILDNNDVEKLVASGENVAFVRENKNLAIETVAPVQANDELFVKTIAFQANKNYTFKVNTVNFDSTVTAKMVDMYLNTESPLDVTQPSFVTFSTTADAASYGSDRFKIVFNSTALGNDNFAKNTIAVYPNPIVNNQFTIALPSSVSGKVTVSMSNMLGQEVYNMTSEATPSMQVQPKQQLQEGIYIVSVSSNGTVTQAKVIVKN